MKLKINNLKLKIKRVAVAMSGGVDSSSVAKILSDKGYECVGIYMRLGIHGSCCDEAAARRVCQKLGIKFYPLDLSRHFEKEVKNYFLKSYEAGLTPNPCVVCNKLIKFGELLQAAKRLECDYLATGHYVKLKEIKGVYKIFRPKDKKKDQTYFLYNLTQEQLKHILFPLSDIKKEEIKEKAKKDGLPHLIKESQDVCFLDGDHNDFLQDNLKMKKGLIKTLDGKVVGEHKGLPLYTIGQRKGIEIGGTGPYYAVRADYKENVLYVTNDNNDKSLFAVELRAEKVNWISGQAPKMPYECQAVIRYRHAPVPCVISVIARSDSDEATRLGTVSPGLLRFARNDIYSVKFSAPQRAVTPGQSVVFYQGDELIGGGTIIN